jgi:hypothetical protein
MNKKGNKMKRLITLGIVGVLALSGCSASSQPQPTVTVTAEVAQPQQASKSTQRDEFKMYMEVAEVGDYLLSDTGIDILIDHAKNVCNYIREGMTASEITYLMTTAYALSDVDTDVFDALLAASVASVYVYCPEYVTFWD